MKKISHSLEELYANLDEDSKIYIENCVYANLEGCGEMASNPFYQILEGANSYVSSLFINNEYAPYMDCEFKNIPNEFQYVSEEEFDFQKQHMEYDNYVNSIEVAKKIKVVAYRYADYIAGSGKNDKSLLTDDFMKNVWLITNRASELALKAVKNLRETPKVEKSESKRV